VLYGATGGEAFIRGVAGERFCVRNSGAVAVVEGTGDHCAEYMTGGRLIVLGAVGRNFAAGMSGGIAYILNTDGKFAYFCNCGMVELTPIFEYEDQHFVKTLLEKHLLYTGSAVAEHVLEHWHVFMPQFIKVMPLEYKRALQEMKLEETKRQLESISKTERLGEIY
jgi:glutamate synthase (NADPH/NADH) large chain